MSRAIALGSLFLIANAWAAPPPKAVNLSVGVRGTSLTQVRGATFYDSWQITPVVYVGLFEHRLQFLGNSLEYTDYAFEKVLRARTRVYSISDDPLYTTSGEAKGVRNSRRSTWEWLNTLEIFIPDHDTYYGEVDIRYGYDLVAHHGHYFEISPKIGIGKFFQRDDIYWIQPQLFATFGYADTEHNRYFYGSGSGGHTHFQTGVQFLFPPRVDTAYPVLQLSHFQVLGKRNREGDLVNSKRSGFQVVGYLLYGVF